MSFMFNKKYEYILNKYMEIWSRIKESPLRKTPCITDRMNDVKRVMESLKKEIKKRIEQLHLSDENLMKARSFRVILVAGICYECM